MLLSRIARSQALRSSRLPLTRLTAVRYSSTGDSMSYEEFTAKYEKDLDEAYDSFELQRILNNAFAFDLVPAPTVLEHGLLAARRLNDFPAAVRLFEALKQKVDNEQQYQAYLDELKDTREELGVVLKEDLYPKEK